MSTSKEKEFSNIYVMRNKKRIKLEDPLPNNDQYHNQTDEEDTARNEILIKHGSQNDEYYFESQIKREDSQRKSSDVHQNIYLENENKRTVELKHSRETIQETHNLQEERNVLIGHFLSLIQKLNQCYNDVKT